MLNKPYFQQFSNKNPMQQEVHVQDIEPDIFKIILKFLYTDKVNLDPDNVMAILYAGKWFGDVEQNVFDFKASNVCFSCSKNLKVEFRFGNFLICGSLLTNKRRSFKM